MEGPSESSAIDNEPWTTILRPESQIDHVLLDALANQNVTDMRAREPRDEDGQEATSTASRPRATRPVTLGASGAERRIVQDERTSGRGEPWPLPLRIRKNTSTTDRSAPQMSNQTPPSNLHPPEAPEGTHSMTLRAQARASTLSCSSQKYWEIEAPRLRVVFLAREMCRKVERSTLLSDSQADASALQRTGEVIEICLGRLETLGVLLRRDFDGHCDSAAPVARARLRTPLEHLSEALRYVQAAFILYSRQKKDWNVFLHPIHCLEHDTLDLSRKVLDYTRALMT
ncbi:hypothetical protein NLU13_1253 [Sarocladium strictum]|uniref:Uncharacterized protein n=1 Tax=Sarocladium strictum TaxID=5046 RepID=A0AA39GRC7_SARSR|nr:hypothetical protein NLU13_1253 [Sarocladium strictum]